MLYSWCRFFTENQCCNSNFATPMYPQCSKSVTIPQTVSNGGCSDNIGVPMIPVTCNYEIMISLK